MVTFWSVSMNKNISIAMTLLLFRVPEEESCDMTCAWCWLHGSSGGLGISLGCWINTRRGWLCPSSFRGWQNECQLAGILCWSGDLSRIVPNSQGDCLNRTNALHRGWSRWMDGPLPWPPPPMREQPHRMVAVQRISMMCEKQLHKVIIIQRTFWIVDSWDTHWDSCVLFCFLLIF